MPRSSLFLGLVSLALCAATGCDRFFHVEVHRPGDDDGQAEVDPPAEASAEPSQQSEPAVAQAGTPSKPATTKAAPATPEPEPPKPPEPLSDAAVFVVDGHLVTMTNDGLSTLTSSGYLTERALARGPDERLFVTISGGVSELTTEGLHGYAPGSRISGAAALDVGLDGHAWVMGYEDLAEWDGESWTRTAVDAGAKEGERVLLQDLAVDAAGDVWVTTPDALLRLQGDTWSRVSVPGSGKPLLDQITRGPDGNVYFHARSRVFRAGDSVARVSVKASGYAMLQGFGTSDSRYAVLQTSGDSAAVFLPKNEVRTVRKGRDFDKLGMIQAVAVDERGRVWLAGQAGLAVAPKGGKATVFRSGTIDELAAPVRGMVVLGDGPTLPDPGAIKTGGLRGIVTFDGKPVANGRVELCESPAMLFQGTPCSKAPTRVRATTNAEGEFSLDDIPLGRYGLVVKIGGKWHGTFGRPFGERMVEGSVVDVGTLSFSSKD